VNLMNLVNFVTVLDGSERQYAGQRTGRPEPHGLELEGIALKLL
jgi:hypothetical protein